ncbi:phospholipase [Rhodohalobacter sp. SW132]|uniref:alpha/beta hydrolase n=1 Tax=Rhodohalobacter sp. SW132 TaxID=2293433 RepID=UPI000E235756|nr:alpha/beta hydrolase [Rhodohalobacter sp. SW132]REL37804.1 phospholipase [Rhodohalobacter sp. SW132]
MPLFRIKPNQPVSGPHQEENFVESGAPVSRAKAAMIMIHGRGAEAKGILSLSDDFAQPDIHYIAPQAAGRTWYPHPFTEPLKKNEPWLNSALQRVDDLIQQLNGQGIGTGKIVLLGFSQGACLALEYAARHPRRYGGVIGLSGGLIGEEIRASEYSGDLENTPVLIGSGDQDPYLELKRVDESAALFDTLNADVSKQIYPGKGHVIVEDEVKYIRALFSSILYGDSIS